MLKDNTLLCLSWFVLLKDDVSYVIIITFLLKDDIYLSLSLCASWRMVVNLSILDCVMFIIICPLELRLCIMYIIMFLLNDNVCTFISFRFRGVYFNNVSYFRIWSVIVVFIITCPLEINDNYCCLYYHVSYWRILFVSFLIRLISYS